MAIKRRDLPALSVSSDHLGQIDAAFQSAGFQKWKIKSDENALTFVGQSCDGKTIRASTFKSNGFIEHSASKMNHKLDPVQRKKLAKQLQKNGLTQTQIGDRLGVSQKTISNDLKP